MTRLVAAAEAAHPEVGDAAKTASESASLALLRHLAERRAHEHAIHALGVLAVMTKKAEVEQVRQHATARGTIDPARLAMLDGVDAALRAPARRARHPSRQRERSRPTLARRPPLLAIADDASPHLRAAIAMLLSRFEDEASRDACSRCSTIPMPIVREAAVRAMGAKSRLTRELLTKVLDDPDADRAQRRRARGLGHDLGRAARGRSGGASRRRTKGVGKPASTRRSMRTPRWRR